MIDSSWIPKVEAALNWYDRTISEFPNSAASRLAYKGKMKTLLGWKEPGKYGSPQGIKGDFSKYMPMLLATFMEYKKANPTDPSLQAFRYQIAQTYWSAKDWKNTRKWLNEIIERSEGKEGFYHSLANLRLKKIEY